ncbi:MAG: hypothetical protein R2874_03510 [Desulfobacterales bacterium]
MTDPEIELAGQLGATARQRCRRRFCGGGLRAGASVKISEDGQTITFGQNGAGGGGDVGVKTPVGFGGFGKWGIDVSAMGGWELEMSAEQYSKLTPYQKTKLSDPTYAAWLAATNEDIGLYDNGNKNFPRASVGLHAGGEQEESLKERQVLGGKAKGQIMFRMDGTGLG